MTRSIAATIRVGSIIGNVRWRKRCSAEAPSTIAASNGSGGSAARPAMQISATIGVHIQASTATRVGTTMSGSDSHSGGWAMPMPPSRKRTMPSVGSSMITHTSPMATGVATIGRISSARQRSRPGKRSCISSAMPSPSGRLEARPRAVNQKVRPRASVKRRVLGELDEIAAGPRSAAARSPPSTSDAGSSTPR